MHWKFTVFSSPPNRCVQAVLMGLLLLLTATLAAGSGATARIENLTKLPGTNRGFPAEDFFTFHRSQRQTNSRGTVLWFANRATMRIHNDGTNPLVITRLTTTNTSNFTISGVIIPTGGLKVAPGGYVDATVNFVTDGGEARRLLTERLVMDSNADNAASVKATFRGAYMTYVEGGSEINVQQVYESFGFGTRMGVDNNGNLQVRPGSDFPQEKNVNSGKEGDLIIPGLFVQANPAKPVSMIQMAAFHGPGYAPTELRNAAASHLVGGMKYLHGERSHQTLLPRLSDTSNDPAGDYAASIGEPFQILVAGFKSTGGAYDGSRPDELLGVRIYRAVDGSGRTIPNEYIIVQDYIGTGCGAGSSNCDWNDNVSYIANVRPQAVPSSLEIPDLIVTGGVTKVYPVADYFDRGYPGNRLTYSARLVGGGSLPNWITLDPNSATFTVNAPENATDRSYSIAVTATDYNGLKTVSTLDLQVMASEGDPDPDPEPAPAPTQGDFWLEAECALVGGRWTEEASPAASGGKYVVFQDGNFYGAPPADEAGNRVRFVLMDAIPGDYRLFARIDAPSGLDDSYWVRVNNGGWYKWASGMQQGVGFAWNQLPGAPLSLQEGTNTVDFAFREDGTRLDKIFLTSGGTTPTGTGAAATNCDAPAEATAFWLEAECGSLGSGWQSFTEQNAANSAYVEFTGDRHIAEPTTNEPAQQVTFPVDLASGGEYHLFLRLDAPDPGRNSLWVRIDDGEWVKMWEEIGGAQLLTSGFEWRKVNDDGADISFTLAAGPHLIRIANREPGTRLDKVYLSPSSELPTGLGASATNCGTAAATLRPERTEFSAVAPQQTRMDGQPALYPNPSRGEINLSWESPFTGTVEVQVFDLTGREVHRTRLEKATTFIEAQLDLPHLPQGSYRLLLTEGDHRTILPFARLQ
ncbi:hypothetical protein GGR26_002271 [Lewinella marina]|uniref:Dystroglycan-type cadherin-like domain-containing protein n=1 Tax=Neolewinella marina TaxID=438751 RepID=A0A2G0CGI8_9BACT|nr:T9SS type A sorting domain-containing protein [Neolewinella marina]NJB86503.1 hypothetical protein [Neolewinella marina]PHK99040.1 hypothetical protein CGL56_06155 [Neolewinella marina]